MAIETLPLYELENDRIESLNDAAWCRLALDVGVTEYSGGSVEERLRRNLEIAETIERELARRAEAVR